MANSPQTRPSLLVRLRDTQDREAWRQFVEVYAEVVYGFLRNRGLQDADAADVTQDVLQLVAAAIGRLDYDPCRGTFRGWLYTLTRHQLAKFLDRRKRQPQGTGDTEAHLRLDEQPGREPALDALWDQEYERHLFTWAVERVRGGFEESTWQAFWGTAVEGKSALEVADVLGMSVGAVYVARSRVSGRLKEQIRQLQGE